MYYLIAWLGLNVNFVCNCLEQLSLVVHELERAQKSGDDDELRRVIEKLNSSVRAALPLPDQPT